MDFVFVLFSSMIPRKYRHEPSKKASGKTTELWNKAFQ